MILFPLSVENLILGAFGNARCYNGGNPPPGSPVLRARETRLLSLVHRNALAHLGGLFFIPILCNAAS